MLRLLALLALAGSSLPGPRGPICMGPPLMSNARQPIFALATASGVGMGTECACTNITGTRGEAITISRATVAECVAGNGQLVVQCPANKPRVTRGIASETQLGFFVESAGVNWLLGSARDLSNSHYTKSSMTCTRTAIGMRGDANGATTCTATGSNATVIQTLDHTTITGQPTVKACGSFFIRRNTGTGTVSVTYDGSTYTDITSSLSASVWKRVAKNTTIAGDRLISVSSMCATASSDPALGVKLATSGDAVDIDFVQIETNDINSNGVGVFTSTSPIDGVGGASRAADIFTTPKPGAMIDTQGCMGWTAIWGVKSFGGPHFSLGDTAGFFAYLPDPSDFYLYDGTNNPGPSHPSISVNTPFSIVGTWSAGALTGTTSGGGPLSSGYDGTIIGSGNTMWLGSRFHGGSVDSSSILNGVMRNVLVDNTTVNCQWSGSAGGGWIEYVDWEWPGTTTTMIPIVTDFSARTLSDGGIPIGATNIYTTHPDYDGGVVVEDAGIFFVRGLDAGPNIWTNIPYVQNGFPSTASGVKYEVCFSPAFNDTQWNNGQSPDWDGTIYLADFNNVTEHAATFILGADFPKDIYVRTVGVGGQETFILDGGTIGWTAGQNFCVSGEWIPVTDGGTRCDARIRYDPCGATPVPKCTASTVVGSDIGLGICPNTPNYLTLAQRQFGEDMSNLAPSTVHVSAVRAWAP